MKSMKIEKTPTTFLLPANDLRAAFQCITSDETRYYLLGVFVDIAARKLVGLDGQAMLTIDLPESAYVGPDCATQANGFILSADHTDKAWRAKSAGMLWAYGDTETGLIQFLDAPSDPQAGDDHSHIGTLEFNRIDGTFPDWTRAVACGKGGARAFAYNPAIMGKLVKASNVIRKGGFLNIRPGASPSDPARVDFSVSYRMQGTIAPAPRWLANDTPLHLTEGI